MNGKSDCMDGKVKVAHIVGKFNGGGVQSVVMNYCENMNRNKFEFTFIVDSDSKNIPYKEIEKIGAKIILVPPYQKIAQYQKALASIFDEYQFDIVHSHINSLSYFPLKVAYQKNIPVRIAHSHSTSGKSEYIKNIVKFILRQFANRYPNERIACSELAGRWLFGSENDFCVINNGIDLDRFRFSQNDRLAIRRELNISADGVILGNIGRMVPQKNQAYLIDIFKEYHMINPNSYLVFLGKGPLQDNLKAYAIECGLSDRIIFLGYRKDSEKLYQAFDVFVLPSLYEGLPVVGVEAQASGLPCLFSNNVTNEVKIAENVKFLSIDEDPSIWAAEIDGLINMSREIDISDFDEFDIEVQVEQLEEFYIKALKRSRGAFICKPSL